MTTSPYRAAQLGLFEVGRVENAVDADKPVGLSRKKGKIKKKRAEGEYGDATPAPACRVSPRSRRTTHRSKGLLHVRKGDVLVANFHVARPVKAAGRVPAGSDKRE